MSVIIDGLVTEFIAVMKRIGELESEADEEAFLDGLEAAMPQDEPSYVSGMNVIAVFFDDAEGHMS